MVRLQAAARRNIAQDAPSTSPDRTRNDPIPSATEMAEQTLYDAEFELDSALEEELAAETSIGAPSNPVSDSIDDEMERLLADLEVGRPERA